MKGPLQSAPVKCWRLRPYHNIETWSCDADLYPAGCQNQFTANGCPFDVIMLVSYFIVRHLFILWKNNSGDCILKIHCID